jgi:hypothetical protein
MHIPESTWRREYRLGGGTKPVRDLRFPNRWLYGRYDPELAQQRTNERAAQKGPRQKLLKSVADRVRDLVKEPDRHRSIYDALMIVREEFPDTPLPSLRSLYYHVEAGDIGLTHDDLPYRRKHKRKRNPAHPARTVLGRRKLEELPAEAVAPTAAGHVQCDTVVSCAGGRGGVFVVYDRLSRRYCLEKLVSIDQEGDPLVRREIGPHRQFPAIGEGEGQFHIRSQELGLPFALLRYFRPWNIIGKKKRHQRALPGQGKDLFGKMIRVGVAHKDKHRLAGFRLRQFSAEIVKQEIRGRKPYQKSAVRDKFDLHQTFLICIISQHSGLRRLFPGAASLNLHLLY